MPVGALGQPGKAARAGQGPGAAQDEAGGCFDRCGLQGAQDLVFAPVGEHGGLVGGQGLAEAGLAGQDPAGPAAGFLATTPARGGCLRL